MIPLTVEANATAQTSGVRRDELRLKVCGTGQTNPFQRENEIGLPGLVKPGVRLYPVSYFPIKPEQSVKEENRNADL